MNNIAVLSIKLFLVFSFFGCKTEHNNTNTPISNITNQVKSQKKENNLNNAKLAEKRYIGKYKYSLAQWSLNKQLFDGSIDNLDFAQVADSFGFEGVEYVNQFFKDKAEDFNYLQKMKNAASKAGVKSLLIMVDSEGDLAELDNTIRKKAVESHFKWVDAAYFLGCHSIRVNLFGVGSKIGVAKAAIKSLSELCIYAKTKSINIIVENHGGYSSDAIWLSNIMTKVAMDNCGTLPDFGNFCLMREGGKQWGSPCIDEYPKYKGVKELLPYAKGVSAKSFNFDKSGEETTIEYKKMMDLVRNSGYRGYIGIEYEGDKLPALEGILATKILLDRY